MKQRASHLESTKYDKQKKATKKSFRL